MPAGDGFKTLIGVAFKKTFEEPQVCYVWIEISKNKKTRLVWKTERADGSMGEGLIGDCMTASRERCFKEFFDMVAEGCESDEDVLVDAWSCEDVVIRIRLIKTSPVEYIRVSWREYMLIKGLYFDKSIEGVYVEGTFQDALTMQLVKFSSNVRSAK